MRHFFDGFEKAAQEKTAAFPALVAGAARILGRSGLGLTKKIMKNPLKTLTLGSGVYFVGASASDTSRKLARPPTRTYVGANSGRTM